MSDPSLVLHGSHTLDLIRRGEKRGRLLEGLRTFAPKPPAVAEKLPSIQQFRIHHDVFGAGTTVRK